MKGLSCGIARREINPPRNCPLLGYDQRAEIFPQGGNEGVLDPLRATVILWKSPTENLVWVHLDLAISENRAVHFYRKILSPICRVPAEKIFFFCTHTHSGPFPWLPEWGDDPVERVPDPLREDPSANYARQLGESLAACALDAMRDLVPVEAIETRSGVLAHGYIRRVETDPRTGDPAVAMAWNLREWSGPAPRPSADPAVVFFTVKRRGRADWHGCNAAAHPVVLGKHSNVVSADWPGALRGAWQSRRPGEDLLFFHGAGGDVHPWLATGCDPADPAKVAAPLLQYLELLGNVPVSSEKDGPPLSFVRKTFTLREQTLELSACRVGGLPVVALPGEIFSATGRSLREQMSPAIMLATTSNGWTGYWPPEQAFPAGGYEVEVSPDRQPGDAEWLVRSARELLEELP